MVSLLHNYKADRLNIVYCKLFVTLLYIEQIYDKKMSQLLHSYLRNSC